MEFEIISLIAEEKRYYPSSVDLGILDNGNYIKHEEVEIPLGKSRYGGPIIDFPPTVGHPDGLRFVCQLDLKEISRYDKTGLLPKTGQLIVFSDIIKGKGKVIYSKADNEELNRIIIEHDANFWDGVIIKEAKSEIENLKDRYRFPEDDWEKENLTHVLNQDGKLWDDFAGSDKSKLFGIFTHCQLGEEAIKKKIEDNKIVLVQFGENGFNAEGVFSVLIDKQDLQNLNFESCEYYWGQS